MVECWWKPEWDVTWVVETGEGVDGPRGRRDECSESTSFSVGRVLGSLVKWMSRGTPPIVIGR